MEKEDVTVTVRLMGIFPGDPPRILTSELLRRDGRPVRHFQQLVPVPDPELFARLRAEVREGDTVRVTVTTEWYPDGTNSYVTDYTLPVHSVTPELEEATT